MTERAGPARRGAEREGRGLQALLPRRTLRSLPSSNLNGGRVLLSREAARLGETGRKVGVRAAHPARQARWYRGQQPSLEASLL